MFKEILWKTARPARERLQAEHCGNQTSSSQHQGHRSSWRLRLMPRRLVCFFLLGVSASAAWADTVRVMVMFRDGTPTWVQQKLITQSRAKVVTWFSVVNTAVLELPAASLLETTTSLTNTLGIGSLLPGIVSTVETAFSFLSKRVGLEIEALEVDFYISLPDRPGEAPARLVTPAYPLPLAGGYRWNLRQIALDRADKKVQGGGVHVAVVDTGIDASHPLLAGKVGSSYNARLREDTTDYLDRNGHGTHVAGIIAAAASAPHVADVMRGIAPEVTLHAVRILDETGNGYLTDLINGLVWIYQQPQIRVVNMSLGSTNSSRVVEKIVQKLYAAGVVLVASSGNCQVTTTNDTGGNGEGGDGEGGDGEGGDSAPTNQGCSQQEVKYPAAYWQTIAVGATDIDAQVAYYSMTGPHVALVAPGGTRLKGRVVSTTTTVNASTASGSTDGTAGNSLGANGEGGDGEGGEGEGGDGEGGDGEGGDSESGDGTSGGIGGLYGLGSGTSQAAPHVTGLVALIRSVNPALTPAQVRTILQETAIDIGAPATAQGAGLINAARAVEQAKRWR